MTRYIVVIFICLLFFSSCNREEAKTKQEIISINIDKLENKTKKEAKLSDFVTNSKIVNLETNDQCYIGRINDIQVINDTIYILDRHIAKTLFLFSINGNFLNKISRIGKGPGEFMEPEAFDVDPLKHEIMLYDNTFNKINIYSKSGKYLRNIKLKKRINDFTYCDGYYYLYAYPFNAIENKIIHKLNPSGSIIWSALDSKDLIKRKYAVGLTGGNFYRLNNEIIFWRDIHTKIYSIKNEVISPKFILHTEKHKITEDKAKNSFNELHFKTNMLHNIREYSENSRYSLFNFYLGTKQIYVIYDKFNNNIHSTEILKDDLNNLYPIYFRILDDNRMLGVVLSSMIRSYEEESKGNNMDGYKNPSIVLYNFHK